MEYLTFLKIIHLLGLMAGLGGALYTDFLLITRGVLKPLQAETLDEVQRLARIVTLGLLLLWISGIALAIEIIQIKPEFMQNDKFWAKVAIVVALTINGIIIHHVVLNSARKMIGRRLLIDSNLLMITVMAVSGSISFVSWMTPFILGKAPEFSYVVPFEVIMTFWMMAVMIACAAVLIMVALQDFICRTFSHKTSRIPRLFGCTP